MGQSQILPHTVQTPNKNYRSAAWTLTTLGIPHGKLSKGNVTVARKHETNESWRQKEATEPKNGQSPGYKHPVNSVSVLITWPVAASAGWGGLFYLCPHQPFLVDRTFFPVYFSAVFYCYLKLGFVFVDFADPTPLIYAK